MTEDFNRLMDQLQGNLGKLANDPQAAASDFDMPEVTGEGNALDDQIRVEMTKSEFSSLQIDPRAMRQSNVELAEHLLAAFNAALTDHNEKAAEALLEAHPTGDAENMQQELRQIQTQSVQAMKKYTDSLFDALGQMSRIKGD